MSLRSARTAKLRSRRCRRIEPQVPSNPGVHYASRRKSLDHELRARGIRVVVIEPAYTKTMPNEAPVTSAIFPLSAAMLFPCTLKWVVIAALKPHLVESARKLRFGPHLMR